MHGLWHHVWRVIQAPTQDFSKASEWAECGLAHRAAGFGRGQSTGARYMRSSCKPVTFRRRDRRNIQPTRVMVMRALGFTLRVKNTTAGPPFLLLLVSFAKCLPTVGIISAAARSEVNGR